MRPFERKWRFHAFFGKQEVILGQKTDHEISEISVSEVRSTPGKSSYISFEA